MRRERIGLAAMVILAAVPAACAASAPEKGSKPAEPATELPAEISDVAALAMKTLSDHLSVPAKDISFVSITPTEWRDSSMGCAKPDRGYMQVIMPGHLAVLEHGGREYSVHIAGKRAFVCEPAVGKTQKKKEVSLAPLINMLPAERLQELAMEDLAKRLHVPVGEITVAKTRRVEWSDESLGCPKPGETYMFKRTKGHVFELQHRGRTYAYHADMQRVIACPPIEAK